MSDEIVDTIVNETTPVEVTTPTIEAPAEPVVEKTLEELAAEAEKARIALLQEKIKIIVQELLKTDFTVHEIGYAADLFKGWVTILTHSTEQHELLMKIDNEANDVYLNTKVCDLISVRTPDEKAPEQSSATTAPASDTVAV